MPPTHSQSTAVLVQLLFDTDAAGARQEISRALESGVTPLDLLTHRLIPALDTLGKMVTSEYQASIAQLFLAVQFADEIIRDLLPQDSETHFSKGTVVLGTAFGDFHALGKRIVGGFLRAHGFRVVDLGVHVTPERFMEEALSHKAFVIGISSMLRSSAVGVRGPSAVRQLMDSKAAGTDMHLIVGGAPYLHDNSLGESVGANGWAPDATSAVALVESLFQNRKDEHATP